MHKKLFSSDSHQPSATLFGIASIPTKYSTKAGVIFIE
jgi:hypothetical protein